MSYGNETLAILSLYHNSAGKTCEVYFYEYLINVKGIPTSINWCIVALIVGQKIGF